MSTTSSWPRPPGHAYCARCREPLDWRVLDGAGWWVHPPHLQITGHEPDPVVVEEDDLGLDERGHCDFCGALAPRFHYPCGDFAVMVVADDAVPAQISHGAWAACAACAEIIETGDADALARRVAGKSRYLRGRDERRAFTRVLAVTYRHFLAERTGPRVARW